MSGGGDTPAKTLWKASPWATLCGEYQNGKLFVNGPNKNEVFQMTDTGEIESFGELTPENIENLKTGFAGIFGEIRSVQVSIVTGLAIGDDMPNWDLYEWVDR